MDAIIPKTPRSRPSRSAMIVVLTTLATVALGHFALVRLDRAIHQARDTDPDFWNRYDLVANRLRTLAPTKPTTFIMIGTSRAEIGFRGDAAEAAVRTMSEKPLVAFNFGFPGCDAGYYRCALKRLLRLGVRPDYLLVEIHPGLLRDVDGVPWGLRWQNPSRYSSQERRELRDMGVMTMPQLSTLDEHFAWYLHRASLRKTALGWWSKTVASGDGRHDVWGALMPPDPASVPAEERQKSLAHARTQTSENLQGWSPGPVALGCVDRLLETCKGEGISVILVRMPEGPAFRTWYNEETGEALRAAIAGIQQKHQVPLIDALTWVDDDRYYFDSHHLWPAGGERFSRRLVETMVDAGLLPGFERSHPNVFVPVSAPRK